MKTKLLITLFAFLALTGCTFNKKTNDIYLIPAGYEGEVFAFYNVKGAPEVKQEGDYQVHHINEDGYFAASTPDMDYGTVTDKYYYIDENGQKTKIRKECVRGMGTGSFENDPDSLNKINIHYRGIEITKSGCSQEFMQSGSGADGSNEESMLSKVLQKYYGADLIMDTK